MSDKTVVGVHWSFWLIGTAGLIFNLLGCMNYMAQMNPETVASMPDAYQAMVEARPAWGTGAFALAVFGGALGCVLLLLRRPPVIYVFAVALAGAIMAQLPFFGMTEFPAEAWVGWLSQLIVGAFLIWYSILIKNKGWIN